MKKLFTIAILCIAILVALVSFRREQASIIGRVIPLEGAEMIWAINLNDSVKTIVADGKFTLQVKPGRYRLVVLAKAPYKNTAVENVLARDGEVTDVGEIVMRQ